MQVRNLRLGVSTVWSLEKFESKLAAMKELYEVRALLQPLCALGEKAQGTGSFPGRGVGQRTGRSRAHADRSYHPLGLPLPAGGVTGWRHCDCGNSRVSCCTCPLVTVRPGHARPRRGWRRRRASSRALLPRPRVALWVFEVCCVRGHGCKNISARDHFNILFPAFRLLKLRPKHEISITLQCSQFDCQKYCHLPDLPVCFSLHLITGESED